MENPDEQLLKVKFDEFQLQVVLDQFVKQLIKYYSKASIPKQSAVGNTYCGLTKPGWYFHDETWSYCYGPYRTRRGAQCALTRYARKLGF